MLEQIEIIDIPPTIVCKYPKVYNYDEVLKNISYLHKIAEKKATGVVVCLGENLDYKTTEELKICYPIQITDYAKYSKSELITLPQTKSISAIFTTISSSSLSIALNKLRDIANDKGYKTIAPYRICYPKEVNLVDSIVTIQIPLEIL